MTTPILCWHQKGSKQLHFIPICSEFWTVNRELVSEEKQKMTSFDQRWKTCVSNHRFKSTLETLQEDADRLQLQSIDLTDVLHKHKLTSFLPVAELEHSDGFDLLTLKLQGEKERLSEILGEHGT